MAKRTPSMEEAAAADDGVFMENVIRPCIATLNENDQADTDSRLFKVMPTVIRRIHELAR